MLYRVVTIFLILLILTHYIHINSTLVQIRSSGQVEINMRYFGVIDQRGSTYVYSSGGVKYLLPDRIQAKMGSRIKIVAKVSRSTDSMPSFMSNEIRLIQPRISEVAGISDSGILLFAYFYEILIKSRGKVVDLLRFSLPEPHSSIAAGMLLGERQNFDTDEYDRLQTVGLLHVVAASGSNVVLVLSLLEEFLRKGRGRVKTLILVFCIWMYCGYARFSSTIVRASLMSTLQIIARYYGREYIGLWALFLSGAVMLVVDPYLVFSLSFQLSMLASFAMAEVYPKLSKIFLNESMGTIARLLFSTFLSSVAVSLITAPLLIYQFGSYSIISFASNAAMLWLVPYIMAFSIVFACASTLLPFYSSIFAVPIWICCELWVRLTKLFATVPYALVELPAIAGPLIIIPSFYAVFMIYRRAKYVL